MNFGQNNGIFIFGDFPKFLEENIWFYEQVLTHIGVGSIIDGHIEVEKCASGKKEGDCIERLLLDEKINEKFANVNLAIGHTRWATCGGKEDHNAHPHTDCDGEVTLVHNGTILNHRELKEYVKSHNIEFMSETDTEVISQVISIELKTGVTPQKAIENTLEKLEGTWGLVIIFKREPNTIYCAQNGSHIVIGLGDDEVFIASEARAFEKYTRNIIEMQDGEILKIG